MLINAGFEGSTKCSLNTLINTELHKLKKAKRIHKTKGGKFKRIVAKSGGAT